MNGSFEVCLADAFDSEADAVFARVKNAVLAGAVVLEF